MTDVYMNSKYLGTVDNADEFVQSMKDSRRKGSLSTNVNIQFDKLIEKKISVRENKILFMSRLEKEKGIYELIDAVDRLIQKNYSVSLTVAGDGKEMKNILKKILLYIIYVWTIRLMKH